MAWTTLCSLDDLTEGVGRFVNISGRQLAVFLRAGEVYVSDNYCPHAGGSLAGGYLHENYLVCPWHQWAFHLHTGQLMNSTRIAINIYPARLLPQEKGPPLVQADLP